jgi:hypothetical protein
MRICYTGKVKWSRFTAAEEHESGNLKPLEACGCGVGTMGSLYPCLGLKVVVDERDNLAFGQSYFAYFSFWIRVMAERCRQTLRWDQSQWLLRTCNPLKLIQATVEIRTIHPGTSNMFSTILHNHTEMNLKKYEGLNPVQTRKTLDQRVGPAKISARLRTLSPCPREQWRPPRNTPAAENPGLKVVLTELRWTLSSTRGVICLQVHWCSDENAQGRIAHQYLLKAHRVCKKQVGIVVPT